MNVSVPLISPVTGLTLNDAGKPRALYVKTLYFGQTDLIFRLLICFWFSSRVRRLDRFERFARNCTQTGWGRTHTRDGCQDGKRKDQGAHG